MFVFKILTLVALSYSQDLNEDQVVDITGIEVEEATLPKLSVEKLISSDLTPETREKIESYLTLPDWAYSQELLDLGDMLKKRVRKGLIQDLIDEKMKRFLANKPMESRAKKRSCHKSIEPNSRKKQHPVKDVIVISPKG